MSLSYIILAFPAILIALTVHEYAHGLVAYWCGDTTARDSGRLTLNPIAHLDPLGTIMMIGTLLWRFVPFGWAKPVPVNPYNLGNPRRDMMLVSAAGPLSNVLMALFCAYILKYAPPHSSSSYFSYLGPLMEMLVRINLGLSFFNLLPIPPLDGSKILMGFLPGRLVPAYLQHSRHFGIIFVVLIVLERSAGISTISWVLGPLWSSYLRFWQLFIL